MADNPMRASLAGEETPTTDQGLTPPQHRLVPPTGHPGADAADGVDGGTDGGDGNSEDALAPGFITQVDWWMIDLFDDRIDWLGGWLGGLLIE